MSGRHQPENGADSEARHYFKVVLDERYGDDRITRRLPAWGPRDLKNLCADLYPEYVLVHFVEEEAVAA